MLIEFKNDPLPPRTRRVGVGREKSDLRVATERMEVGQCFYLTFNRKDYNKVAATASIVAKQQEKKFSIRKLHKDQENLIGVWRVG